LFSQNTAAKDQDVTSTFHPQGGVFRTTTRLVILDVVATDDKGQPVSDLKAEDFTVTENGEPQHISEFSFHYPAKVTAAARTQPAKCHLQCTAIFRQ